MPRMYQLSQLFVRGSIFNQTAKHLDDSQRQQIDRLYEAIMTNPETATPLQSIRARLHNTLDSTIGSEYSESRGTDLRVTKDRPLLHSVRESYAAADAEFNIIVWKAALWVYHATYTYQCKHCGANAYTGTEGRTVTFDRAYDFCPNCNHVELTGPDGTKTYHHKLAVADQPYRSPIKAIAANPKVGAAQIGALINDPRQLTRLVSQFSKGYIHQILRENKIKYDTVRTPMSGPACDMAHHELIGLLAEYGIKAWPTTPYGEHPFCIGTSTSLLLSPPQFTAALMDLVDRYVGHGVQIDAEPQIITIRQTGETKVINVIVVKKSPKLVVTDTESIPGGEDGSSDILERTEYSLDQKASNMPSPASQYETADMVASIRADLYDPLHLAIFDIITEGSATPPTDRKTWEEYLEWRFQAEEQRRNQGKRRRPPDIRGQDVKPKLAAEFLGISHKQAEKILDDLKVISLAHGLNHRDHTEDEYTD